MQSVDDKQLHRAAVLASRGLQAAQAGRPRVCCRDWGALGRGCRCWCDLCVMTQAAIHQCKRIPDQAGFPVGKKLHQAHSCASRPSLTKHILLAVIWELHEVPRKRSGKSRTPSSKHLADCPSSPPLAPSAAQFTPSLGSSSALHAGRTCRRLPNLAAERQGDGMSQGQLGQRPVEGKPAGQATTANCQLAALPAVQPAPAHSLRHRRGEAVAAPASPAASRPASPTSPPRLTVLQQDGAVAACTSTALPAEPLSPRTSARLRQQQAEQQQPATGLIEPANGSARQAVAAPAAKQQAPSGAVEMRHERQQQQPLLEEAPRLQDRSTRQRQRDADWPPAPATAGAAAAEGPAPAALQQAQRQDGAASPAAPPLPEHEHNTRHAQRQREELARRKVSFAPGPWAGKFSTHDGHPDHEGQLARQRRSSGMGWGRDLTPSAVRAVEAELGEECRPSIDRLKRRWVGAGTGGVWWGWGGAPSL